MTDLFILLLMIFLHVVDDYYFQGILAKMKQKTFWQENAPEPMYRYDYLWALLMHAFSWTFMVMLPIMFLNNFVLDSEFLLYFIFNLMIHAQTDDLKANARKINLWQDQMIHMLQILMIFIRYVVFGG